MPHAAGQKIAGSHASLIDTAVTVVEAANSLDCVSKIVLGVIQQIKSAPVDKSLKITEVPAGLKVRVRGPKTVQQLFIYTHDRAVTTAALDRAFKT